jgi:Tol biopolymer transport system component
MVLTLNLQSFYRPVIDDVITRLSTSSDGSQSFNGYVDGPQVSADGRYVVFESSAADLVSGDQNDKSDIFYKDLYTGETKRLSTAADGSEANNESGSAIISADGRYIVFASAASNLVPNDTNGGTWNSQDIFRKDLLSGEVLRINTTAQGQEAQYGAFGTSLSAAISTDGRYVTFVSSAANLVAGDTNNANDIFRKDVSTGTITRVSTDSADAQIAVGSSNPHISANGRYVVFESASAALVEGDDATIDIFRKDLDTGEIVKVSATARDAQGHEAGANSDS